MDIHAPDKPVHSFKDFAIHIAVVTIGILIALGLEGVRESIHDRHLVRETRESVRFEMGYNREHAIDEIKRVTAGDERLKKLADAMPALAEQHPEQVLAEVEAVKNPYYFFTANSWQAALSTGALAHMSTDEASTYAGADVVVRIYSGLQASTLTQESKTIALLQSHPHPSAEQVEQETEQVLLFSRAEHDLAFVGPQMQGGINRAWEAASR